MPVHVVVAVVMAVMAVVQTVSSMQAASEQKKARNRQLAIEAKQREMQRVSQDLRLKRDARMRESMLLNSQARTGAESSSFKGSTQAVKTNLERDLELSKQGALLASEADDVTRQQISLDASRQRNAALFSGITSVAKAGVTIYDNMPGPSTFDGSTSSDTGDVFSDQAGGLNN